MRPIRTPFVCLIMLGSGVVTMALNGSRAGSMRIAGDEKRGPAEDTKSHQGAKVSKKTGVPKIWQDRGELTPTRVYFGWTNSASDPLTRLPMAPFTKFAPDDNDKMATSPKANLTDSKKVKWTAKFGEEVHSDTTAPRLAWALGFGSVEGYYVGSGKVEGVNATTKLSALKGIIQADGSFSGGARFKRHDKGFAPAKDGKGNDITWDEAKNPGVPPEQLSGLVIFDVLVNNWDAQRKNSKVYHLKGANGSEDWYIVNDYGASFADGPRHKFVLSGYRKDPSFIKSVSGDKVEFTFRCPIHYQAKIHQRVPAAHAKWFRQQLLKLTDAEIQAAFDAGFATDGLNRAYITGDEGMIKAAREKELTAATRTEIAGFVAAFRARIEEFKSKIPAE